MPDKRPDKAMLQPPDQLVGLDCEPILVGKPL